ncbi:serine/threonine kinase [Colletotrichum musicola]|uniref:non-specific serine/threonine protein kinase n=1 Tax=Colletotrichum musicola TaxID=2175873 RepID=A0A8H6N7A4_9PEZI|nr:serine/threonine kinase [Colletotrichum musicola]
MADTDGDDGWTKVHRQFQGHPDRLPPAQRELFELERIKEWESSEGHWSGLGKHPADFAESKKIHLKIVAPKDNNLGWGTYGRVEKVTHRSVCLARKWIQPRHNRTIDVLREEAHVMERLDHDHIVKLIGTYTFRQRELYLLLWPVAVCNLSELLTDLEDLKSGQGDREDIVKRLEALGLTDLSAVESKGRSFAKPSSKGRCPLKFLQRIMGCIGQAVTYCHHSNIRHLDLKPTNILLNPERVYLADFGIARDVNDQEQTTTIGHQGTPKWRAPEIYDFKGWSMKSADIYSLGLIYLNIATAVYHGNLSAFYTVLGDLLPRSRAEKLHHYQQQLAEQALATQNFRKADLPTVEPRHVLDLTRKMLSLEPASRPRADQVDQELVDLGGIEQVYHSTCCRKSVRYVAKRMDNRYSQVYEENARLKDENERLKKENATWSAKDETYEMRIKNQEGRHAKDVERVAKQLEDEKRKRRHLEEKLREMETRSSRRHSRIGLPRPEPSKDARISSVDLSLGPGPRTRPITHPIPQSAVRPPPALTSTPPVAPSRPAPGTRIPTDPLKAWATRNPIVMAGIPAPGAISRSGDSPSPGPQTPTCALRSRGSGSRLPVLAKTPATPGSSTPNLARDPSWTDSTQASMSSSIFSRRSFETATDAAPTPPAASPAVKQAGFDPFVRQVPEQQVQPDEPRTLVVVSMPPSVSSAASSPRTTRAELASVAGSERSNDMPDVVKAPSLPTAKSWAAIAGEPYGLAKMVGSPPRVHSVVSAPQSVPVSAARERSRGPA